MATALYKSVIFGPVHSRRLGVSLGINLMSVDRKVCNFECIYCECGWTGKGHAVHNPKEEVIAQLRQTLKTMHAEGKHLDVMTFAGNGEPTMHPDFEEIIAATIEARDELFPEAKIAVLSNATMIGRESVRRALMRVDRNILKLDSAFDSTVQLIDQPSGNYRVADVVEHCKQFNHNLIIQTMFLRGTYKGHVVDNTVEREVSAWLHLMEEIRPNEIMIYTIDRDTPAPDLQKVPVSELKAIAERVEKLRIKCSVAG